MKIFFPILILLILINELESDILVQQIPDTLFPLGVLCQKDSVFPFNSEACDDILITLDDWKLDSVTTWWLTGSGFVSWAEVSNIRLKIYPDSGINPPMPRDSSIYLTIIENSQISVIPLSQDIWRVTIELPDSYCLNFNQRFWVTVQPSNIFGSNGKTFWIADTGIGNGFSGYYRCSTLGYPQWTGINTVFQQDYSSARRRPGFSDGLHFLYGQGRKRCPKEDYPPEQPRSGSHLCRICGAHHPIRSEGNQNQPNL